MRRPSRLRPLPWLREDPGGAVAAETSWTRWCQVGWLSLAPTTRAVLACVAVPNVFLAVQRTKRGQGATGHAGFGRQGLRRRDLVGLPGDVRRASWFDVEVRGHRRGVGGGRAQHLGGTAAVGPAEVRRTSRFDAAAQRPAIESGAALPGGRARRLQQGGRAAERRFHPGRAEPSEDVADGGARRRAAPVRAESRVQPAAMDGDGGDDAATRVAAAHHSQAP